MKTDSTKHKHMWRVQKDSIVEWFFGSKKGKGVVTSVVTEVINGQKEVTEVVIIDKAQNKVTIPVGNVRMIMTDSAKKKKKYEDKYFDQH